MLERLILRPELCVFEKALSERLKIVAGLDDERFAKPRTIEHLVNGSLIVISEYVGGRRLSDIIDAAAEHGIVAGLDAGLGLLLELLPAVARLHDAGLAHGALAAGRVMITPAGQVLLLDAMYAEPLERLQLTRKRLWSELRLAFAPAAGLVRFDKAADLSHCAMVAAALIVGRPLRADEYPDGIGPLRQEINEIASIRGTKAFAEAVDAFFAATLPMTGRKGIASADEAAIDLRKLVRKELGIATCRAALTEFLQQVEAGDAERLVAESAQRDAKVKQETERLAKATAEAARLARERTEAERAAREEAERKTRETAERKAREETERKAREEAERKAREEAEREAREEAERKAREEGERKAREEAERKAREEAERKAREEAERKAREQAERKAREEAERKAREEAERKAREEAERKAREEAERKAREEAERKAREEAERKAREEAERKAREEAERKAREEDERKAREEAERNAREDAERKAREQAERKAREEAERKAREEAERKAREEAERKAREEAERKAREEAERKARAEAERKAREEAERAAREKAAQEQRERERLAREARERAEQARLEAERLEAERLEAERLDRERAAHVARERAERERKEAERLEREARERAEEHAREQAERERLERDRQARERLMQEERERNERAERERVAAAEAAARAAATPEPPPAEQSGKWLVNPAHAAAFERAMDAVPPAQPPVAAKPYPIYVPPAEPAAWTADVPAEPPPPVEITSFAGATASEIASAKTPSPMPAIRLKDASGILKLRDAGTSLESSRAELRNEPDDAISAGESYTLDTIEEPRQPIPWKLIAAGIALIAVAFAITHFMSSSAPVIARVEKAIPAPAPKPPAPVVTAGEIDVKTDPSGLKVLLDGKPAGESPITLKNVSVGKHTVTLVGNGGTLRRTVRVEPGVGASVDVSVFAGFLKISAPFIIDIAENGKAIGTSDDAVILGPGRHNLYLSNTDLDYSARQEVEIQPGETTELQLNPKGHASINATPWAEVWVDGKKIGETPMADAEIPLGAREILFKHPQFPDRKLTATIKGHGKQLITIDFNKDK